MNPSVQSVRVAGGLAHFSVQVHLEPEDIIKLIASLSFDETERLLTHDKFKYLVDMHTHLRFLRDHGDSRQADDNSTATGDKVFTPSTSASDSCIDSRSDQAEDGKSSDGTCENFDVGDEVSDESSQLSPTTPPTTDVSLLSKLESPELLEDVQQAYPYGWTDKFPDFAHIALDVISPDARSKQLRQLQPLRNIHIRHVHSTWFPSTGALLRTLRASRTSSGRCDYTAYELADALQSWYFDPFLG